MTMDLTVGANLFFWTTDATRGFYERLRAAPPHPGPWSPWVEAESLRRAQEVLGEVSTEESDIGITLFSALKRQGVGDAAEILQHCALGAMVLPDFTPPPAEPDDEPAAGPA